MATIYDITNELVELAQMAEEQMIPEEVYRDTFESLEYEFEEKCEAYAKLIRNISSDIAGLEQERDRLQSKINSAKNCIANLKKVINDMCLMTGKTKFKTKIFSFYLQKNPPSVFIPNEEAVPDEYKVVTTTINKGKLLDEMKAGKQFSFAEMRQGESMRIR